MATSQISTVLNAELLDSPESFSYRDIQRLCVRLGLGGKGKREVLVKKLQDWHRSRSPPKKFKKSPTSRKSPDGDEISLPMNVVGQRFCLLPINVAPDPTKLSGACSNSDDEAESSSSSASTAAVSAKKRRRSSIIGNEHALIENVSPRLLNPLTSKNDIFSPKSIVKSG
jgi:hypothetical protein